MMSISTGHTVSQKSPAGTGPAVHRGKPFYRLHSVPCLSTLLPHLTASHLYDRFPNKLRAHRFQCRVCSGGNPKHRNKSFMISHRLSQAPAAHHLLPPAFISPPMPLLPIFPLHSHTFQPDSLCGFPSPLCLAGS